MKHKVIAVILTVVMMFSGAFRCFEVRASAEAATAIVLGLASLGISWAVQAIGQLMAPDAAKIYDEYANGMLTADDTLKFDPILGIWSVNEDVMSLYSEEQQDTFQSISDKLNRYGAGSALIDYDPIGHSWSIATGNYNRLVDDAVGSIADGFSAHALSIGLDAARELSDKLKDATLKFDVLTGEFGYELPATSTVVDLDFDGYHIYKPYKYPGVGYFSSEEEAFNAGSTRIYSYYNYHVASTVYLGYRSVVSYGFGYYFIYNNKPYFYCHNKYNSKTEGELYTVQGGFDFKKFISPTGVSFSDVAPKDSNGYEVTEGLYFGYYTITDPVAVNRPTAEISIDDFTETTDADYIELTKDKTHQTIADAADAGILSSDPMLTIKDGQITAVDGINMDSLNDNIDTITRAEMLGLISDNPTVTVDDEGNITAVDDIPIDQLEKLTESIGEEGLSFEDFEAYYKQIVKLLKVSNTDTASMTRILNNIKAKEQTISSDVSKINTAVQTIADALTAEAVLEEELTPQEDEFSFITVEHTGLDEAQDMVDRLPIVGQTKTLLGNLLDENNYSTAAPSFSFYWDSNGDGTQEKYTALDLSFLETPLTNNNLEDKNRFQKPMTVREFIQLLIIFVCYVAFFIKIIKKLPSLIGGGDGYNSDIKTEDKTSKPPEF